MQPNFKSDIQNIFNHLLHFHARQMDQRLGFSLRKYLLKYFLPYLLKFEICWMGTIFFWFEKYVYMVCLKMAHLRRVTYCFETLLFFIICKVVFCKSNFHKNKNTKEVSIKTRSTSASRSIKGWVTSRTTAEMVYSWGYITRSIITASQIFLLLFWHCCKNMFFLRKFAQYPSSFIYPHSSGPRFILHKFKSNKKK